MKIAYIIEHIAGNGGLERNISSKSNYLVENYGYDITIVTLRQQNRPYSYALNHLIHVIDLGLDFEGKSSKIIKRETQDKLEEFLCKMRFDICVSWGGIDVYSLYKIKDGSKKVLEFHFDYTTFDMWSQAIRPKFLSIVVAHLRRMLFINVAKKYDRFVLLTKQDELKWRRYCKNTTYIHNPLFLSPNYNFNESFINKQICAIGRLDYQKGYDLLIAAWHHITKKHPDWHLCICGDGPERIPLQHMIEKEHLKNNVKLCGFCKDVGQVLSQSQIFVFPSRYEGFGNVLLEAMSYGVTPVSFKCPCGPEEIIENNISGILVPHMDILSLVNEVNYLIENEDVRKEMGRNAIIRSKKFSIQSIMHKWDTLFNSVLNNS